MLERSISKARILLGAGAYSKPNMRVNIAITVLLVSTATAVAGSVVSMPRQDSSSFAGSNEYFLHALPAAEQKTYVETLAGWGVKVLRLWGE